MPKKIALDWDNSELRLIAANCGGDTVKVTDASVIALSGRTAEETLAAEVESRGWSKAEALVAIGRGKAELRELQLPVVPDDELPDMVRFQAIRSFASAGENATVDYLVTRRKESGIEMIGAAVGPGQLQSIQSVCHKAGLQVRRVSLRPLCSAALYLAKETSDDGEVVLIDLLADEAEIVIARSGQVKFLRTTKLPTDSASRASTLSGELKRSLLASGSVADTRRIVLWGRSEVHREDIARLSEATGSDIEMMDPFSLVDVERKAAENLPEHIGRLAPLVGLLVADETHSHRLIDFLQPRKRPEPKSNTLKTALLAGVPLAACLLVGWFLYRQLSTLDHRGDTIEQSNASMTDLVEVSTKSRANVALVDEFLDGNVNWLDELARMSKEMPPSEKVLLTSLNATTERGGGGRLTIVGKATDPAAIEEMESALRDEFRNVIRQGSNEERGDDHYRRSFRQFVKIDGKPIHDARYQALNDASSEPNEQPKTEAQPETEGQSERSAEEARPARSSRASQGESDGGAESEPEKQPAPESGDQAAPSEPTEATEETQS